MQNKYFHFLIFIPLILHISCYGKENSEPSLPAIPAGIGVQALPLWDPPADAVHIDPDAATGSIQNGTREHPFRDFNTIEWKDHTTYAIRRGSTLHSNEIVILADHVTLASYGDGPRPVIMSSATSHALSTRWEDSQNITIRDIEIIAPSAASAIIIRTGSRNASIINCRIQGPRWGIRVLNFIEHVRIHNTEVFNILEDGIFIMNTRHIEISNCYIHRVNQAWKPPYTPENIASGDGIQLSNCNHWHVHHNIIDRSDTGNKFCFISNNPSQDQGIFEHNYLRGPIDEGYAIYIGDGRNMVFRYNYMEGNSKSPLWSHARDLKIYYNVFMGFRGPLFVSGSAEVMNNLFYQMQAGIEGGRITAINNIFDLASPASPRFRVNQLTESYNLFTQGLPTAGSFTGNAIYRDPMAADFRPMSGSDVINRGTSTGIGLDLDGNRVPTGEAPDIGPFEWQP